MPEANLSGIIVEVTTIFRTKREIVSASVENKWNVWETWFTKQLNELIRGVCRSYENTSN